MSGSHCDGRVALMPRQLIGGHRTGRLTGDLLTERALEVAGASVSPDSVSSPRLPTIPPRQGRRSPL